jgi:hypothetical protein
MRPDSSMMLVRALKLAEAVASCEWDEAEGESDRRGGENSIARGRKYKKGKGDERSW